MSRSLDVLIFFFSPSHSWCFLSLGPPLIREVIGSLSLSLSLDLKLDDRKKKKRKRERERDLSHLDRVPDLNHRRRVARIRKPLRMLKIGRRESLFLLELVNHT